MTDDPIPRLKQQLRQAILAGLGRKNQRVAARILGVHETRMSNIDLGKLERFSLQKLIRLLARINRRVDMTVVIVGPIADARDQEFWEACERVRGSRTT
ncbi:MAG: XRE family transcriptional regulator [Gemmatimonadaceae bacterium]